jgi:hypothetical protein
MLLSNDLPSQHLRVASKHCRVDTENITSCPDLQNSILFTLQLRRTVQTTGRGLDPRERTQSAPTRHPNAVQNRKDCISGCSCVALYFYPSNMVQTEAIKANIRAVFADKKVNCWARELLRNWFRTI